MGEHALISLASIVVFGIGAQWLAWRIRLPSILLLLLAGFFAGPVTGLVHPDELLGETLFPIVSISVGIILFEGGLTLRLGEIHNVRRVIFRLISLGAIVTWAVATLAAYYVVGLDFKLSLLAGAIFIVSGPTVVTPLLKHVRPSGQVSPILKWEGILIDPVGATLAVLVFEIVIVAEQEAGQAAAMAMGVIQTLAVGILIGVTVALGMIQVFKRYWVPEELQNPVAVMLIVGAFTVSNHFQAESGLLTTTLMGIVLANQRSISVKHLSQFKEDVGVLLLSGLFVLLAARLELESLSNLGVRAIAFLLILIFIARPLAVWLSTNGSELKRNERLFLSWLAPRGIVAVSVASLFALELTEIDYPGAEQLVPLTFLVVVGTVATYGLSASWVAQRLGLAQPDAEGVLFVGAHPWARAMAGVLASEDIPVAMVDTNWTAVYDARMEGLNAVYASVLSNQALDELPMSQLGHMMALTRNDEVNSLAALRFFDVFDRADVYQLPVQNADSSRRTSNLEAHLCGRCLFDVSVTFPYIEGRFEAGAIVKKVKLTNTFGFEAFHKRYGATTVPLFLINEEGKLLFFTADTPLTPRAGHVLIALVDPVNEQDEPSRTTNGTSTNAGETGNNGAISASAAQANHEAATEASSTMPHEKETI